jgi:hypothetical protein
MTIEQGESHHACTARRNPNYHLAALAMHIFPLDLWDMFLFFMPIYIDHCKRTCTLYVIRSISEFYMVSEQ